MSQYDIEVNWSHDPIFDPQIFLAISWNVFFLPNLRYFDNLFFCCKVLRNSRRNENTAHESGNYEISGCLDDKYDFQLTLRYIFQLLYGIYFCPIRWVTKTLHLLLLWLLCQILQTHYSPPVKNYTYPWFKTENYVCHGGEGPLASSVKHDGNIKTGVSTTLKHTS